MELDLVWYCPVMGYADSICPMYYMRRWRLVLDIVL